ncbi:non-ribosomal peptide synthetase [Pedobacter sp. D749]|uniref:non-ribosomal peptide synthetase n=1 Tax=Pedobacter sp. D749 TaxID=2856523 RepID=UPI001C59E3EB|nr:non-ribosomal peptide synthetase [Pedobacter sp. D749]QXU43268.1 amino acid adenylation domain-containing protein [Pedobacter sp. D749]
MHHKLIHEVFRQVAIDYPNLTAIEEDLNIVTYAELDARSDKLSAVLSAQTNKMGRVIAVFLPKGIDLVTAILAIFKSGTIYLPLDLNFPLKRITEILNELDVDGIITTEESRSEIEKIALENSVHINEIFTFDNSCSINIYNQTARGFERCDEATYVPENSKNIVDPDSGCYIFYTSGSTGVGKPILGRHKSLHHFINWEIKEFELDHNCRVSHLIQKTFDPSLRDIFVPLCSGGTLCVPSVAIVSNPILLLKWLKQASITLVHYVPSLFKTLTRELEVMSGEECSFPALKFMLLSGEILYSTDLKKWWDNTESNTEFVNLYGPTETTLAKMFHRIKAISGTTAQILPVGRPINDTHVAIINEANQICGVGEIGEIYIKTSFISLGYYRNKDLTRAVFVQNPLIKDKADIVYKTGDLGKYLEDRNIQVMGRLDDQVKLNGVRIDLKEIELSVIKLHEVESAVIIADRDQENQISLICYFIGESANEELLRSHLKNEVGASMVPSYFVKLVDFPLNLNGKVDKKALLKLFKIDESKLQYEPAEGTTEVRLAEIWKKILGVSKVSRNASFFKIGGHSLKALQLISAIYKEFNINLSISELFKKPILAELANLIDHSQLFEYSDISHIPDSVYYDLSHSQRRLWALSHQPGSGLAYNLVGTHVLEGDLDVEAFRRAFGEVVSRHEILRTGFHEVSGEPVQQVEPFSSMGFSVVYRDLRGLSEDSVELQEIIREEVSKPFDLSEAGLLRSQLLHLSADRYLFVFTMHHIISDGWSMRVLLKEVSVLYLYYKKGGAYPLAELRLQYRDYARWQVQELADPAHRSRAYWKEQFSGQLPLLSVRGDKSRPVQKSYNGSREHFMIGADVSDGLSMLSRSHDSTLYMGVLTSLYILLYKYSHQRDIIIGTPVSGRSHRDLEEQIGFYVNTLALRMQFEESWSYIGLLRRVKERCLEAFAHDQYPFDCLLEDLSLVRDPGRSPLFDVMLTFEGSGSSEEMLEGITISNNETELPVSKFDLTWIVVSGESGLSVNIEYNTDLFSREWILQLGSHYQELLRSIVLNPDMRLHELNCLTTAEAERFHQVPFFSFPLGTLHSVFEERVLAGGSSVALSYQGASLSYSELSFRSNQLARYLRDVQGVTANDLIGILLSPGLDMVVSVLGILKAGGGYVPLDPSYPEDRIGFMVKDSSVKAVLTTGSFSVLLGSCSGPTVLLVDEVFSGQGSYSGASLADLNNPADTAYVIYTSGSTGTPKGVSVSHSNVMNLLFHDDFEYEFSSSDVWVLAHSLCFDFSVWELFGSLLNGGRLVVISRDTARNTMAFADMLETERVSVLNQTPSMFSNLLTEILERDHIRLGLRYVIFGGEALKPGMLQLWHKRYPDVRLVNMYGITETTVHVTIKEIGESEITCGQSNIGVPFKSHYICLVDDLLCPVPDGSVGEIIVGGASVSGGYLNRESLSGERFISLPGRPSERFYRSGDLAVRMPNGEYVYMGRKDMQVKIRGYRIETGEIESVLMGHSSVRSAAVLARTDASGIASLCAYYSVTEALDSSEVRNYLRMHLPDYMLPSVYIKVDSIPYTSNGKADYDQLKSIVLAEEEEKPLALPETEIQSVLLSVWQGVLNRFHLGIDDNFFEVGGDSIKAIQISSRLYKEGYKLEVRQLFEHPTIRLQSLYVSPVVVVADQGAVHGEVLLSPVQQWFFGSGHPDRHHYNQSVMLAVPSGLDESGLSSILTALQRHHDILRVYYKEAGRDIRQLTGDLSHPVSVKVLDLRGKINWQQQMHDSGQQVQESMDLSSGPLLKVVLFRLDSGDRLLLVSHHLVIDGVSWRILFEDLDQLTIQYRNGEEYKLPLKTDSYQRWVSGLLAHVPVLQSLEQDYWAAVVERSLGSKLWPSFEGSYQTGEMGVVSFTLDRDETEMLLTGVNGAYNTEINDILLTGLFRSLHQEYGQDRLLVSMEGHGREEILAGVDISRTVGWFTSIYPLLLEVSVGSSISDQLIAVKEQLRQVPSRGIGYGILAYLGNGVLSGSISPEISFNYLGQFDSDTADKEFDIATESSGQSRSPRTQSTFVLDISGMIVSGELTLELGYHQLHIPAEQAVRLKDHYHNALKEIINHCANLETKQLTPSDFSYKLSTNDLEKLFD